MFESHRPQIRVKAHNDHKQTRDTKNEYKQLKYGQKETQDGMKIVENDWKETKNEHKGWKISKDTKTLQNSLNMAEKRHKMARKWLRNDWKEIENDHKLLNDKETHHYFVSLPDWVGVGPIINVNNSCEEERWSEDSIVGQTIGWWLCNRAVESKGCHESEMFNMSPWFPRQDTNLCTVNHTDTPFYTFQKSYLCSLLNVTYKPTI